MFHERDNMFFQRCPDGSVRLLKYPSETRWSGQPVGDMPGTPDHEPIMDHIIDENGWASVIASVSEGNELDGRFYAALDFHRSKGPIKIIKG